MPYRKSWASRLAALFAIFLILLNFVPIITIAHADSWSGPSVNTPNVSVPNINVPNVNSPNVTVPKWEVPTSNPPSWDIPNTDSPSIQQPNVNTPEWNTPEINKPTTNVPSVNTPNIGNPNINSPDINTPNANTPTSKNPQINTPNVSTPNVNVSNTNTADVDTPNVETPAIQNPSINSPVSETPQTNNPNIKPYDITKYVVKDVIGDTVKYTTTALNTDIGKPINEFGKFHTKMLLSGYKVFTNNSFTDVGDMYFAASDGLGAYKNFDTLKKKNISSLFKIKKTNITPSRAGLNFSAKAIAKANIATSAVSLAFSTKDTFNNLNNVLEENGDKKTDAIIKSVDSIGDMLVDGGTIATAAIPGAQVVGFGLVVVGALLKLGSAGARLWRRGTIQKGLRKIKSLFA